MTESTHSSSMKLWKKILVFACFIGIISLVLYGAWGVSMAWGETATVKKITETFVTDGIQGSWSTTIIVQSATHGNITLTNQNVVGLSQRYFGALVTQEVIGLTKNNFGVYTIVIRT